MIVLPHNLNDRIFFKKIGGFFKIHNFMLFRKFNVRINFDEPMQGYEAKFTNETEKCSIEIYCTHRHIMATIKGVISYSQYTNSKVCQ